MAPRLENLAQDRMLSTGKVADLLSVTPDTVLKWIKSGRLRARRTAGGHYRVAQSDLEGLIRDDLGPEPAENGDFLYCWEYYAKAGEPSESCQECLVFRARARRCYEMSGLARENGYAGVFCTNTCAECAYYQEIVRRPRRVLIVTESDDLRQRLEADARNSRVQVEFASSEYECSAACAAFKPEYVVIDGSLSRPRRSSLCSHLAVDPRIPGVQIIMVVAADSSVDASPESGLGDRAIPRTFDLAELEDHIIGLEVKHEAPA